MSHAFSRRPFRAAAALVLLAGAAACVNRASTRAHENHAPLPTRGVTIVGNTVLLSEKARHAIGLTTEKITHGELRRIVEVNARVELPWDQQAMITSLVPGIIEKVSPRPGQKVAAGEELARIVSTELETFQRNLLQASSEQRLASRLVQQQKKLEAEGVVAGKNLLQAESDLARVTADFRIAAEKLGSLGIDEKARRRIVATGKTLPYISIRSPIAGVITHADVRPGQVVKVTDHLFHVANTDRVWVVGEVLEPDVRSLAKGQSVVARFSPYPGKQFEGVIDHIRLKMDRRRRTQSVVMSVKNTDGLLRPGMFGRVEIAVQVATEAVLCPADAILKSRSGRYVLVQRKPGKYESRRIRIGLEKKDLVEVLAGTEGYDDVYVGNRVVVTGAYLLASLLGNEHKARVLGAEDQSVDLPKDDGQQATVVDAIVELPTDRKSLAGSHITGRISNVLVAPGQRVKAGQVLAEIDSIEMQTVQLDLLQTLTRQRLVEQSRQRLAQLGEENIVPQRRLWELQNQLEVLRNKVASLQRQLAFFGLTKKEIAHLRQVDLSGEAANNGLLGSVPILAPTAGWIVDFKVVPGQIVRPDDVLFEIHDFSRVWVKGYVFQRDAPRVSVGQRARLAFSAIPDVQATGTLVRIAPVMEENERVLPIWIEVENPELLLKEGMFARVALLPGESAPARKTDE